jgi:uncharacterized membrane protein YfcA
MSLAFFIFLFCSGSAIGFLSGLLGIGGGIVMFPILLYLLPLLGFERIDVKSITGLTMAQGFFASLSAMLFYHSQRLVNKSLVLTLGLSLFLSSLAGSIVSGGVADRSLLVIFGIMALTASVMMCIPRSYSKDGMKEDAVEFHRPTAVVAGVVIGFFVGMVGQGGAFIIIPVLLYILKVPLRVALGSTLAIGLFSSTAGLAGKIATGQVPFKIAGALLLGAIPFAQLGGRVGQKTDTRFLRWILALLIGVTTLKIWYDLF